MNDPEIRALLHAYINPRSAVIDELMIGNTIGNQTRADVVSLGDLRMHGYEIKGDNDTLKRIPLQLACYSKVFAGVTFVATENHIHKLIPLLPDYAGLMVAYPGKLYEFIPASPHAEQSKTWLAQLLWHKELLDFLAQHGLFAKAKLRCFELYDLLEAAPITLTETEAYVTRCLTKRLPQKMRRRSVAQLPTA
jgi:hypothetical protein